MKKILLVKGFNTSTNDNEGDNIYVNFDIFFKLSNFKLEYFQYDNEEKLECVYDRLTKVLEMNKQQVKLRNQSEYEYDIVIAHSMGGCLMTKYLTEHPEFERRVIMIAPLICKMPNVKLLFRIPFLQYCYIIKASILPNSKLFSTGNILNDSYKWIPIKQIVSAYTFMSDDNDKLVEILNTRKNCHVIYNMDEQFNVIPQKILDSLERCTIIDGKHTCFLEIKNSEKLFDVISTLLA